MLTIEEKAASLNRELLRLIKENKDEKCLEISKTLFNLTHSKSAFSCQIVASIKIGLYHKAIELLEQNDGAWCPLADEMLFEKTYCYYRTHQLDKAIFILNKIKTEQPNYYRNNKLSLLHLEAQILYTKEDYAASLELYDQIKKLSQEDNEEITANILAIESCRTLDENQHQKKINQKANKEYDVNDYSLYECVYNIACIYLGRNDLLKAKELLEISRGQCSAKLIDSDLSLEEKDKETMVIATQLAYTLQLLNKVEEAKEIYESIVHLGVPTDASTIIASNNLVVLNQSASKYSNLFYSAKLLKTSRLSSSIYFELKSFQKRNLILNQALLQHYMKKNSFAYKILENTAFNDKSDISFILLGSMEKNEEKRLSLMKNFVKEYPTSIPIHLAYIQLLLKGNPEEGLSLLVTLLERLDQNKFNIPISLSALLIWLYQRNGMTDRAFDILDKIESSLDSEVDKLDLNEKYILVKKQFAAFNLRIGRYKTAAKQYEYLVKLNPNDMQSMAGLVIAYQVIDPTKSDKYIDSLPKINIEHINVEQLEYNLVGIKINHNNPNNKTKKEKKKKKRKPLLPKLLIDKPDPERWLSKSERTKNKQKKKKK